MTPSRYFSYLTGLLLWNMVKMDDVKAPQLVTQRRSLISPNVGENLTLRCFYGHETARYYWYIQRMGDKPELISISYKYETGGTFYGDFKDNPRFKLQTEPGESHFTISAVQVSDTATYFCASGLSFVFEFGEGSTVLVKDSGLNAYASVHQPESGSVPTAGSVTLNCTVYNGTCDGKHTVYWFKASQETHPEIIYTRGDGTDRCERNPNGQTRSCVHNLPMENLNESDAGTYYCAVASCGRILFGNGTKLDVKSEGNSLHLVYVLSGGLIFTTILNTLLVFILLKLYKRDNSQTPESQVSAANTEDYQDAADLHYAAVNVNPANRSRRQRTNTHTECVYSVTKQQAGRC